MGGGFDPRACADRLRDRPLSRMGTGFVEAPEGYFCGRWDELHPLNVPGPFYGGGTDTCGDGLPLAPDNLLYDHKAVGFVYRQPRDEAETVALLHGANSDPFRGYGWDGDQRWTPTLVRRWWRERGERQLLVDRLVADFDTDPALTGQNAGDEPLIRGAVASYLAYLDAGMATDLRRYLFFLENGEYPSDDDELPTLE